MFEARNIAFSYSGRPVLRDVSFVVSPGETVCVLGENGAGKTTLLRVLATLAVPDSGQVLSEGQDAFTHPLKYRSQLGYLPERVALYDDMTIKEYLTYRANLKGEPPKRIRRRIGEACEICRLPDTMLRTLIGDLSAGQRKRVALADALLLRPRVLLLDDLLSGLDRSLRAASGDIMSNAAAFSAVVVTGHEVEDIAPWATRFLVLRGGVIAASISVAGLALDELRERVDAALAGGVA